MPTATQMPNGDGSHTSTYGVGYGAHPSAGSCPLTDSTSGLYTSCDDGALNETEFVYFRSRTAGVEANPGRLEFAWPEPPAGIVVTSVELVGYLRMANAGGSFWSANAAVQGFVNPNGTRYGGTTCTLSSAATTNTNTSGPTGTFARYSLGVWNVNPATAIAWTLSDLAASTWRGGIQATAPDIPNSFGGADHHFDLTHLERIITYTVSSTMSEPLRTTLSMALRLRERPLRKVMLTVPHQFATVEPGDVIYSATNSIPTPGDAVEVVEPIDAPTTWRERPLLVSRVEHDIVPAENRIEALDLRPVEASLWWPMISDQGVDLNDAGIAYYDQGAGYRVDRAQVGYSRRPDGRYVARAASTSSANAMLRYHSVPSTVTYPGGPGLHVEGGDVEHGLLNNSFSQWGGGAPTSWTRTLAGTATANQDTTDYLIDEAALRSCILVTNDGASNSAYVSQLYAGWTAGTYGRVRLAYKPGSAATPVQWLLRRSDGADWNVGTGAWVAGSPGLWNAATTATGTLLESTLSAGAIVEYISAPITPGGSFGITLYVGNIAGASSTCRIYYATLARGITPECPAWRMVPTTVAAVTTVSDLVKVYSPTAKPVLSPERGTIEASVAPSINHADLANGGVFRAFAVPWQDTTTEFTRVIYLRVNATSGTWRFESVSGGATIAQADWNVTGANLLSAGHRYKISVRWTSTEAELGASRSHSLFVDGALRATVAASGECSANNNAILRLGPTTGITNGWAGLWFSRLRLHRWCLTDAEILRNQS